MTTSAVFLGTPEAAVPSLAALAGIADVRLVLTRPDRPAGRNRHLRPPPVKEAASAFGLAIAQPSDRTELRDAIASAGAVDVAVVVGFGMLIPADVLELPQRGFLNVHFSLLPRWRGAAPVERAIMAGDDTTGVTIMAMDEGLDTGPVIAARDLAIGPVETGGELTGRLAQKGADLLAETFGPWVRGELPALPQPPEGYTYADKITPDTRRLNTQMTPDTFTNTVRALAPEPGAQLDIDGELHKILVARSTNQDLASGQWVVDDGRPILGLAGGAVLIETIQPPGKRPMSGSAWLRGRPLPAS